MPTKKELEEHIDALHKIMSVVDFNQIHINEIALEIIKKNTKDGYANVDLALSYAAAQVLASGKKFIHQRIDQAAEN